MHKSGIKLKPPRLAQGLAADHILRGVEPGAPPRRSSVAPANLRLEKLECFTSRVPLDSRLTWAKKQ